MSFPLNVYLTAFLAAGFTAALALPVWRYWCVRTGLVDDPGHRKIHDRPIPLAGGLAVMTGLLLPALAAALWLWASPDAGSFLDREQRLELPRPFPRLDSNTSFRLRHGLNRRALELAGIFTGAVGMLTVGLLDDKRELRPATKFAGQFLIALLVAASGLRITLFVQSPVFHYGITILWILTLTNAFNFMDNMNGLCAGLGAIGACYFGVIAAADGQYLVALVAALMFGALLGFLPYNFPAARAFLGDSGSHLVGYLLAVLAILPHFYNRAHPRKWAVVIPLLVLALPLFDLVRVVLVRWKLKRPFYVGDNNHLSHRLVQAGLSRTQAVVVLWCVAAAIGALVYLL